MKLSKEEIFELPKMITANTKATRDADLFTYLGEGIPRFTVKGMNQSELILHLFSMGFNRGWLAKAKDIKNVSTK